MNGISDIFGIFQGEGLKAKSAEGVVTLGAGAGFERLLRLVRTMILTRILAPDEFGLMAIILILVNIFEQLSETGIKTAIVQNKRGAAYEFLNAIWWLQAVRSILLFAAAMAAAPIVCSFYDKPHLLKLLQVALVAIIFRGFISPRVHTLQREYKFGLMTLYVQGSAVIGTIVTIICAYAFRNIWALVIGYTAEHFSLLFLSYIITPFKPRIGIDRNCLKELLLFARGMFGLPIFNLIALAAPTFVLGKVVSEEELGLYALAGQLINMPLVLFSKIAKPVILPGFSKKQDDLASIRRVVYRLSETIASGALPMVGYIMVCSPALMVLLWGPAYEEGTKACVILSLLILARAQIPVLSSVYIAVGKPHLQRNIVVLQTLVTILFVYPAIVHWGLVGAAVISVAGSYIALFMQIIWARKIIALHFSDYIKGYTTGLIMTFAPVITVFVLTFSGTNSLFLITIAGALALLASYVFYLIIKLHIGFRGHSFNASNNPIISEKISALKEETNVI